MVDVLPELALASDNLAKLLIPDGVDTSPATWKEIKRTGSKHNKLYNRRMATLQLHKPCFGTQEYIQPRIVLSALLGQPIQTLDDLPPASWRPDNILLKVNLTQMLNSILIVCNISDWTYRATDALERLDMAFPTGIAGSEFSFDALDLWLELAAHVTIRRLEAVIGSNPNVEPHEEIENVFYDGEGLFKHFETLGVSKASEADSEKAMNMMAELVDLLKAEFKYKSGRNATAATGRLKAQFRWDHFLERVLVYFQNRSSELDQRIAEAGGVEQIIEDLAIEAERRADASNADRLKQSLAKSGSTPRRSLGGKSGIAALKAKEKQIIQPTAASTLAGPDVDAYDEVQDVLTHDFGNNQEPELDLDGEPSKDSSQHVLPPSAITAIERLKDAQKKNKGKSKARFIDPQEGAVREDPHMFGDTQDDLHPPSSAVIVAGKRKRTEDEFDGDAPNPSQDDGFEEDTRDHPNADAHRRQISFTQVQRNRVTSVGPQGDAAGPSHSPSPSKRQRKNPGSAFPLPTQRLTSDDPPVPDSTQFQQWKVNAAANRVLNPGPPKAPQARQPWSADEESALIQLIETHCDDGISYAGLKAIDTELAQSGEARLTRRTAEDLRFKSRNMKVTILLAHAQLPKNWDKVVLDRKAIDRLKSRGIEYDHTPMRVRGTRLPPTQREEPRAAGVNPSPQRARVNANVVDYETPY